MHGTAFAQSKGIYYITSKPTPLATLGSLALLCSIWGSFFLRLCVVAAVTQVDCGVQQEASYSYPSLLGLGHQGPSPRTAEGTDTPS